jgi:phosphoribosylglycinamide formyltransferase-1
VDLKRPLRWAIFVSGRGSNLETFLECEEVDAVLVVSNRKKARALQRARWHGVSTHVMEKGSTWDDLLGILKTYRVDAVFLLGFMKIIPPEFLNSFWGPVLNLHPSLLPKYPGLNSIQAAYEQGDDIGVTVHFVNEEVDGGEILYQSIAVSADQVSSLTLEEAEYAVHRCEHNLVRKVAREWKVSAM